MQALSVITKELPSNDKSRIIIDVNIGNPQIRKIVKTKCLVDTGCRGCAVRKEFARNTLGLVESHKSNSVTPYFTGDKPVYYVDLLFPNFNLLKVPATEFDIGDGFDFIIGMKILRYGDMALTNANGKTVFSFRMPPSDRHIDFRFM